jgi:hypothetical protein
MFKYRMSFVLFIKMNRCLDLHLKKNKTKQGCELTFAGPGTVTIQ